MNTVFKQALVVAAVAFATQASAQVTFYEHDNFEGQSFTTTRPIANFSNSGFNDRASSVVVAQDRWEVCDDVRFGGRCIVLRPGRYASLGAMGLNDRVSSVRAVSRNSSVNENRYAPLAVASQVIFYENEDFQGRTFTTEKQVDNFAREGFNDRASSVVVLGERWEVCSDSRFGGKCMVLRPGRYASLAAMGMNDRISSVRALDGSVQIADARFAPPAGAVYDSRRRNQERLFEADVTSVRAVMGSAEQRCWMEREDVPATKGGMNVGGAVVGALLGGILGHQVGGGVGKDIATVGGAVAGAAVGSKVGRNAAGQPATQREVQRCADTPSAARPEYWDVSYNFRGQEHQVQMTSPPGAHVTVNDQGEPRTQQ
jgi:uncharacterized protein YcfJ